MPAVIWLHSTIHVKRLKIAQETRLRRWKQWDIAYLHQAICATTCLGIGVKSQIGIQFEVESYNEVIIPTKEGIIAYLSSGQIKGIGPK